MLVPMNDNDSGSTSTSSTSTPTPPTKKRRGFAAMSPEAVREISRKGGVAAHASGTAHEFSSEEARAAGRKGGLAAHAKRRANGQ
jgi:general stress protein YciG